MHIRMKGDCVVCMTMVLGEVACVVVVVVLVVVASALKTKHYSTQIKPPHP